MEKVKKILKKITIIKKKINYYRDFCIFRKNNDTRFSVKFKDRYPCLNDSTSNTSFDEHYLYHTAWAARILALTSPKEHIDIGSCLRFVSITSAFIPFRFYDFRPADLKLSNLHSEYADISSLPFPDNSIESISCLHVLEHIGLGRYGDTIDSSGDIKGAKEIERVMAKTGQLLFVVPISGRPRIEFNAHRVYSLEMVKQLFSGLKLKEFSLIPDNAGSIGMIINAEPVQACEQNYGCGCFHFIKE